MMFASLGVGFGPWGLLVSTRLVYTGSNIVTKTCTHKYKPQSSEFTVLFGKEQDVRVFSQL